MSVASAPPRLAPPSPGAPPGLRTHSPGAAAAALATGGAQQQLAATAPAVTTRKFIKDAHAALAALGVNHLAALTDDARAAVQVGQWLR